ncbi:N-formylglutamate amidohydrolase [Sphingomonas lacunae]|uniref:N-formylglutamate amidohydrolase n=1 Tax=Sphingomonas lacunae TaxID=2698828 RepID=A0A6M4AXG1_9SPHN|nr:N-formylglutamate amidohydrolase [Sphingomonas lacunae]QJQ33070.1 N-formylglutamate amidohydrolase [Sphingomonas lacunae]
MSGIRQPWNLLGEPRCGGILLIGDHASNHVPEDIDLGIDRHLLDEHIAIDIGVADVARHMVNSTAVDAAWLAAQSRLVVDLNRDEHAPGLIPIASDGHAIPGNALSHDQHVARLDRFYRPYHRGLADLLSQARPALILSLHSFTPALATSDEARPWQVGVLYNQDDRAARIAIPLLEAEGLCVGDQLPYSGKLLNYTMNVHAEGNGIPYLGIEMRQDTATGSGAQALWAERLGRICNTVTLKLAI